MGEARNRSQCDRIRIKEVSPVIDHCATSGTGCCYFGTPKWTFLDSWLSYINVFVSQELSELTS